MSHYHFFIPDEDCNTLTLQPKRRGPFCNAWPPRLKWRPFHCFQPPYLEATDDEECPLNFEVAKYVDNGNDVGLHKPPSSGVRDGVGLQLRMIPPG